MSPEERWEAVLARDGAADDHFVYAVRSTGVYCRPSCPARRPARRNVVFYPGPDDAEACGYRPCRRCRPGGGDQAAGVAVRMRELCRVLDEATGRPPTLAELGRRVGMSPSHLQRTFKRLFGVTPREYVAARRVERVRQGLREGRPVTSALFDAGYGSTRAFYEQAAGALGMKPAAYRNRGRGEVVTYTIVESSLGHVLVARTERGVCAVRFGEPAELAAGLAQEFAAADVRRDDGVLGEAASAVVAAVDGGGGDPDLPLDLRATAFQLEVWRAIRAIPRGETRSYSAVAASIGRPAAVRAVARACASNPVAVVVPCHRVVAADGSLGGYRWGLDRKRRLLEGEAGGRR